MVFSLLGYGKIFFSFIRVWSFKVGTSCPYNVYFKGFHLSKANAPGDFISLVKNASLVLSNSFHGTAFATIYNKPFISVIDADQQNAVNNNDSRKIDYLNLLGLQDRLIKNDLPSKEELLNCDFTQANKKIKEFREKSYKYLCDALGE